MERLCKSSTYVNMWSLLPQLKPLNQLYVKYQHRRDHLKDSGIPETSIHSTVERDFTVQRITYTERHHTQTLTLKEKKVNNQ